MFIERVAVWLRLVRNRRLKILSVSIVQTKKSYLPKSDLGLGLSRKSRARTFIGESGTSYSKLSPSAHLTPISDLGLSGLGERDWCLRNPSTDAWNRGKQNYIKTAGEKYNHQTNKISAPGPPFLKTGLFVKVIRWSRGHGIRTNIEKIITLILRYFTYQIGCCIGALASRCLWNL